MAQPSTPRGSAKPSIWGDERPSSFMVDRKTDSVQWFSDPASLHPSMGSPFLSKLAMSSGSSPKSHLQQAGLLPRTYQSLRHPSPVAGSPRHSRPSSPGSSATPRRTQTPRAQTPRQTHTATSIFAPQASPQQHVPMRTKTPTRVAEKFYTAASEKTPVPLRYDFDSDQNIVLAQSPSFHRLYTRTNTSTANQGIPSAPATPTAKSVDSFSSAGGLTDVSQDSGLYPGEVAYRNFLSAQLLHQRRDSTPVSMMRAADLGSPMTPRSALPRSSAPTLASLHTPKSINPTPATPILGHYRRVDSDYSPSSSMHASTPVHSNSFTRRLDSEILNGALSPKKDDTDSDENDLVLALSKPPSSAGLSSHQPVSAKSTLRALVSSWNNKYKENSKCYREGGYLTVNKGDILHNRYQMLHKLGWGEFSTVWLARDLSPQNPQNTFVAVKVAKCHPNVTQSTQYEINLLKYICSSSKVTGPVTRLLDTFEHVGQFGVHLCMVMPVMGSNLLCVVDQMKMKRRLRTDKEIAMLKEITAAILRGLDSLEAINVVHTDIKPENVLVALPDPKMVKLVASCVDDPHDAALQQFENGESNGPVVALADFGLSFLLEHPSYLPAGAEKVGLKKDLDVQYPGIANNRKGILIQTREYRAPEVLFGGNITPRSDIWSVGCMVYELITGDFLLDPKKKTSNERDMDVEHVAMIMRILGPVPAHIAKPSQNPARHLSKYFDNDGRFIYADKYRSYTRRSIATELEVFLEPAEAERAAQFIMSCFTYDPLERCHARDLLGHSWLRSIRL